ncbi:MAG: transcription termination/antitermination protein NusA [Desulfobacteraceae bacterium]|nr:transcription termination/antitermination protein NusA [Desulfobacteraceae bacterium]MBC2754441.1 transcription termination/antitermination protein NusA [Desulfobacteraceae bacterium]
MLITDMKRVIEQVSRDKGIEFNVLVKALEEALRSAAKKKFGNKIDIEIQYNDETGELEVFQFKEVVEKVTEPAFQIDMKEGRELDAECEIGDSLGTKMDTTTFGRIAAQSAKQVIIQKLKIAERSAVYNSFVERQGEIINGIVQRTTRNEIIVNLGQAEAVLPKREQIPGESYRRGDRIRAYIVKVLEESRGPQVVLSRTHPAFLINLFKTEVPEINEGVVNIVGAAREAGSRGKIAVSSNDPDIDPIGACVGVKGNRVQSVVQELKGEKIDIIPWHLDPAKFVCNALAPAEVSRVIIDEVNHSMEVVVPDEAQSIAIGRGGQNVRLASKLSGWNLDVKSLTDYDNSIKKGLDSLMELPEMNKTLADILFKEGFFSVEDLAKVSIEELVEVARISEEDAGNFIEQAKQALSAAQKEDNTENNEESADIENNDLADEAATDSDIEDTENTEETEE